MTEVSPRVSESLFTSLVPIEAIFITHSLVVASPVKTKNEVHRNNEPHNCFSFFQSENNANVYHLEIKMEICSSQV